MIEGLSHVALYTPCLEETVSFYQTVFQAEKLGALDHPHKGCWLSLGGDVLEVFESEPLGDGPFKHIAIACDDVDFYYRLALSHGAVPHVPPKDTVLALEKPRFVRIAFMKGPAGEQIELFSETSK